MPALDSFEQIVKTFGNTLAANFNQPVPAQPEDQLKAPVGELLRAVGQLTGLQVHWRTEVHPWDVDGRPDIGIVANGLLTGHVELKSPGMGARPEGFKGRNRTQWNRFKALPNLVYTDGSEWSLYRSGELKCRVRIASDVTMGGTEGLGAEALTNLGELIRDFLYWEPAVPGTAHGLAGFLAPISRILRDEVKKALEQEGSKLKTLANEWGGLLFPEGDEAQFADAYAQTLTYALLLARFEGAESLRPLVAVDALQQDHALLAEALQLLEAGPVRNELRMPIELLERAIGAVDSAMIGHGGDPWLYFYEQFLGAYDPKLRKERGVYFTPVEVVRAQVRLAGELLRTRFGKQMAFADDDVVVLDPAVGTGTYPLAVLDHAAVAVQQWLGPGAVAERLQGLADRLYSFEILVGPYSVAHLRLSQRLRDAGVVGKVPGVYLTDTLESPNRLPDFTASLLQARLTEERKRALEVKKDVRVFVCLGNPPYNRDLRDPNSSDDGSRRKGGWVRYGDEEEAISSPIIEDFLAPVRDAGEGVHLKPLYNDYVYFWRWALWKVFDSSVDSGIVTFITASSYLRGPGFAGMRRKMREVFDELWIIDLEGDSQGTRKTENVFAIRIPVAIAIGVRDGPPRPETPAKVWKTRVTGSTQTKLADLDNAASFENFLWTSCASDFDAPFQPIGVGRFFDWPRIIDLFPWQHTGAILYRTWPIAETKELLVERWKSLIGRSPEDKRAAFRESRDRKITRQYPVLTNPDLREPSIASLDSDSPDPSIAEYSFRTLDRQWVISDSRIGDFMRPELWRAQGDQQVYMVGLLVQLLGMGPAVSVCSAVPDQHHFRGSFGDRGVIPLWRDVSATQPNVTWGLLESISETHSSPVTAEQLFSYAYGILAQPAYVDRFWDELETPPPRLPITKDACLFQRVASHGARLVYLHTYGERFRSHGENGSVPQGLARCTKAVPVEHYPESYCYDPIGQIIRVGDGEFGPVIPEVWNYSVSGLQVVKSWLDYRKLKPAGRKSSPLDDIRPERWVFTTEFLELLWVLEATISLRPEGAALLDEVCASDIFSSEELPGPTDQQRQPPGNLPTQGAQYKLASE